MIAREDRAGVLPEGFAVRRYQETDRDDVRQLHTLALEPTGAIQRCADWVDDLHHI